MSDDPSPRTLGIEPPWAYAAGIMLIVAVQAGDLSRTVRIGVVTLALGLMILIYVRERVQGQTVARPLLLPVGAGGIIGGATLAISGSVVGLAFLAGGLLFLEYSLEEADVT